MSWPAALYTDKVLTTAARCSLPALSQPIPGVSTPYLLTEDWCQQLTGTSSFAAVAMNTAHPEYTSYRLVGEGPLQDLGAGLVKWQRRYAMIPTTHSEFETTAYQFIGWWGLWGVNTTSVTGRPRFTRVVVCKTVCDYWITDGTSQTQNGDTATITTAANIPIVNYTKYLAASGSEIEVDYLADSPPFATATSPTLTAYQSTMSTDAGTATSFSIVVETSRIQRWMGQIFQRSTRYVKAI